ncbi:thyrotroph embryonic factor isoform X10 [Leptidea sinapis]|uniref:thyrotroph embryonic factor isoform X10 n=1 Tax=Leptidea sinapis TaxID=189913 RepID=UPI0021C34B46|nr:thyrotroph embryonic factor isoform X10 [Leptidea sinapis]
MEYQHQLQHPVTPLGPPPPPQPVQHTPLPSLTSIQHAHLQDDDRWSQYHIWRQHVFVNGKSVNSKDVLEDKKDDNELWEAQAAFLGPNLWDKTLPYDPDLKVQEYVDLDEFLSENGMPGEALGGTHLGGSAFGPGAGLALGLQPPVTKRERSPSPSDCMSPDTINPPLSPADSTFSMASSGRDFDPRTRAFSDEELKPQPMIKKSRKQVNDFVPDDLKDDKYWARRRKNNMAAKRSRDARRMKENQIALRAGYLEKENMGLRQEVELLKKENHILREKLSKYADV